MPQISTVQVDLPSIKYLFKYGDLKPNKRLGQNFLIDKNAIKKLLDAAEFTKEDTVMEVGAGLGAITVELAKRAKKIIAVEKDRSLIPLLREAVKDLPNVEIVEGDILRTSYTLKTTSYKLVGNIPYYITAPLIRKFLERANRPEFIVLMVQKEVAQRICAKPPDMSILAVSVQIYAKPEIVAYVPRSSFWPQPRVDSTIIKITPFKNGQWSTVNCQLFFKTVKTGFSSPRKQLINNLSAGLDIERVKVKEWLLKCGIAPERRAETLSIEEWFKLSTSLRLATAIK